MSSTGATAQLPIELEAWLDAERIERGSLLLVACSGGPDSTALAEALSEAAPARSLSIACAYLDHGIRGELERQQEGESVSSLANRLGVALYAASIRPGLLSALASERGASLEDVARERRYGFLEKCADLSGARYIALGHTADDDAETVLMRVLQGVEVSGLGGIPRRRGRLIRPLCRVSRFEVLAYLEAKRIGYVLDSSNTEARYLRNRIRSEIIPAIASVFPAYRRNLAELARKARAVQLSIDRRAEELLPWKRRGDRFTMSWAGFASADGILRAASVLRVLDRFGAKRVPYGLLDPLRAEIPADRRGQILAGAGFRVLRRGELAVVEPDVVRPREIGYLVHVRDPGSCAIPEMGIVVEVGARALDSASQGDAATAPAVVRSFRPGDRVFRGGRWVGVERLAARCTEGVAALERLPILENRRGIVRVYGSAVGCNDMTADPDRDGEGREAWISVTVAMEEQ